MDPQTIQFLIDLNERFYETFGPAFAATRRRIQDGVRRVLITLPDEGTWLDLGCGSGSLAVEWLKAGRTSAYIGLDFSEALLAEARAAVANLPGRERVAFGRANLGGAEWVEEVRALTSGRPLADPQAAEPPLAGVLSFAVFHHIPSRALRLRILRQMAELLPVGGCFIHSEWQFQHSPKLMARRLPWSAVDLDEAQLEPGDTLLDWRFSLPGQPETTGLRYVHLFTEEELQALAQDAGFRVVDTFESDGQGGRLGLYQRWEKY